MARRRRQAGLQPGDILREADGVDLDRDERHGSGAACARTKGDGSDPADRAQMAKLLKSLSRRDVIKIKSVQRRDCWMSNLAYVRLSRFGLQTDEELKGVLEELMAENPDGLILDLRRNPGGGLDTVVEIADEFLPEGLVLVQEFGGRHRSRIHIKRWWARRRDSHGGIN